jgi:hypothetical protein
VILILLQGHSKRIIKHCPRRFHGDHQILCSIQKEDGSSTLIFKLVNYELKTTPYLLRKLVVPYISAAVVSILHVDDYVLYIRVA